MTKKLFIKAKTFYNFEWREYIIRVCLARLLSALDKSEVVSQAPSSLLEEREDENNYLA